jgi:hypothetical protein
MSEQVMVTTEDKTMSVMMANILAGVLMVPAYLLILIPFFLIWGRLILTSYDSIMDLIVLVIIFFVSVAVHEGLHALGYLYGGAKWEEIKFGIKHLSPYAHCRVKMPASKYKLAVALPGIVLGVLPGIAGILFGIDNLALFAAVMLIAATGDWLVLWLLRGTPADTLVQDHLSKVGCLIIPPENS